MAEKLADDGCGKIKTAWEKGSTTETPCSKRLIKCEGVVEFLRLCLNFGVTPTFAQVERRKARKWKKASDNYQREVLEEELRSRLSYLSHLKEEVRNAHKNVREECSFIRYIAIIRTLNTLRQNQYEEMMKSHVSKISRLLSKKFDVDEHINNMSSYRLSFFKKLLICRGLKFSLPQKVAPAEIKANFEKAFWKLEPLIEDPVDKGLASSTLRSIALNYIKSTSPSPPKALVKALNRLKKRDDIVVTKPDKGSGIVVMDKSDLAKWLEEKLKPLSVNEYTITDVFEFADEIRSSPMNEEDILVSYDVTALFTNVPLSETIDILVDKAFTNDWFNQTYDLNLEKEELTQLLEVATTNQLFQFDGQRYEQTDGVAMGSPLGPLMANVFMCHLEDKLARDGMVPSLYKRYVDDTFARMPNTDAAADFLATLNGLHPSLKFTMELPSENTIPFIGIQIIKNGTEHETRVYRKPTNTGLLLHFQSHVDKRYKTGLLNTMLHRAHALSSTTEAFNEECAKLRSIFSRLDYPSGLVNSTINMFILSKPEKKIDDGNTIRIVLPFKDQIAANEVRRQLRDLSGKICVTLQSVFVSKKLEQDLKPKEIKPSIVNRQCVVYKFACDLCDADYVGYTARHLRQRIAEHKHSSIGKHLLEAHGDKNLLNEGQFRVLKKCHGKFDCLVYEMLFIQELKPSLNTQSDSISAKLFV
ncbi:uncharacterized protein [Montipora foliosa]|uniref:uncharacterized protein n=1 Tax=Montipora foliosa TaxID=591990 RepID=UPI0035F14738